MRPFEFIRARDAAHAVAAATADPGAAFLAGGTTQVDLMKDGVLNAFKVELGKRTIVVALSRVPDAAPVGEVPA